MNYFEIGDRVKVSEQNDNDGYDSFRDKELEIVSSTTEGPGYDDTMQGEPLYDLIDVETGEDIPCSLYFYELEKWD